jgi:hypothetical protein
MPSMQAEKQYTAAGYVTSLELDTFMLESLLSCKLDSFEYEISPLSALNISIPENSVVKSPFHTLFEKEQKHRTFADVITEYLTLSLKVTNQGPIKVSNNTSSKNSPVLLNSLAADYSTRDSEAISAYLDQKIAGRFSYRFEAYWCPVEAFPLESELIIGEEPPVNAVRQSIKFSMPLSSGTTSSSTTSRDTLLACANDSVLAAALNSSDKEASNALFQAFNASLDTAAEGGAQVIVELLFPSDYYGSAFGEETDESFQTLLYGVSGDPNAKNSSSVETIFNTYLSDALVSGFQLDSESYPENASQPPDNTSAADLSSLKEILAAHIKNQIRTKLESQYSGELNRTVYSIREAKNLSEAQAFRDSFIDSVSRKTKPAGARIVLSLWNP